MHELCLLCAYYYRKHMRYVFRCTSSELSAAPAVAGNMDALDKAAGAGAPVAIVSGVHKAELGKVGAAASQAPSARRRATPRLTQPT